MISENYRLPVNDKSMIGACILSQQARITLDTEGRNLVLKIHIFQRPAQNCTATGG